MFSYVRDTLRRMGRYSLRHPLSQPLLQCSIRIEIFAAECRLPRVNIAYANFTGLLNNCTCPVHCLCGGGLRSVTSIFTIWVTDIVRMYVCSCNVLRCRRTGRGPVSGRVAPESPRIPSPGVVQCVIQTSVLYAASIFSQLGTEELMHNNELHPRGKLKLKVLRLQNFAI